MKELVVSIAESRDMKRLIAMSWLVAQLVGIREEDALTEEDERDAEELEEAT